MKAQNKRSYPDATPCKRCGYLLGTSVEADLPPTALYHPWNVRNRAAVKAYVETLAEETNEWLLALYVGDELNLLSVHTVGKGSVSGCEINFGNIYLHGRAHGASGFILVHNHPSGDSTPSPQDVRATNWLARISTELNMPLLDHLVVARDGIRSINPGVCEEQSTKH